MPDINIKKIRYLPPEKSFVAPTTKRVVSEIKKNFANCGVFSCLMNENKVI